MCVTTLMVDSVVAVMKDLNSQVTTEHVKVGLYVVLFLVLLLVNLKVTTQNILTVSQLSRA